MTVFMSGKTAAFIRLLHDNVHSGPRHLDLLDAYFINRTRVLKFFYGRNPETELKVQVRGLFSTRNPNHFFVIGRMADKKQRDGVMIVIAYDSYLRAGSWCVLDDAITVLDLLGKEACPFDSAFQFSTTVFDDVVVAALRKAPNQTLTLDEIGTQTGISTPVNILEGVRGRGKITWKQEFGDSGSVTSVSLV